MIQILGAYNIYVFPLADSKRPLYGKFLPKRSRLKSFSACFRFVEAPVLMKISVFDSFTMPSTKTSSELSLKSVESDLLSSSVAVVLVA